MTPKRTPTPWKWQDSFYFEEHLEHQKEGLGANCENIEDGRIQLVGSNGEIVLEEWASYADDCGLSISKQDAQYIVECVNEREALKASHEALLEAVEKASKFVLRVKCNNEAGSQSECRTCDVYTHLLKAIETAKGIK